MKQHLIRLDRIAGELNAWLLAIAIGLAVLDFTVLVVRCMPPFPQLPAAEEVGGSGQPAMAAAPPGSRS